MTEDEERWKNLLLFKIYATDKEMDEMMPFFIGITLFTLIVVVVLFWIFR